MGQPTNPVCDDYIESFTPTGCERCGHPKGDHFPLIARVGWALGDAIGRGQRGARDGRRRGCARV